MPSPTPNPAFRASDEAELLAWVEGERLPRDRELAVAAALSKDPALARRLELMRADLAAVRALPEVSAPPGLMNAVEAALQPMLERQMLLGLQNGTPVEAHLPVSVVQPVRRSPLRALFAERAGRRMAMAAAVLLMVGGASYFAADYLSDSASPKNIAYTPPEKPEPAPQALALKSESPSTPEPIRSARAAAPPAPPEATVTEVEPAPPEMAIASAPAPEESSAPEIFGPPAPGEPVALSAEYAAALAREGRLVIRLTTADPGIMAHPERLTERIRRAASPAWRIGGEVPPAALAQLSAPRWHEAPAAPPITEAPVYAGSTAVPDLAPGMYGPPRPTASELPPPGPAAFMVQTRSDGAALETLRAMLGGSHGEVVFEELDQPLPLDAAPSLNPTAVFWWSQPPAGWTWWAQVPVVVEQAR